MVVAAKWVHVVWIASLVGLVLMLVFGTEAVRRQTGEVLLVRTLGVLAVVLLVMPLIALLAFVAWWLKTWRSERLRPALILLTEYVPSLAMMAASIGLWAYLEDRFKWPTLLSFATSLGVMFAMSIPWWCWLYPGIRQALLRASQGALRAGVAILAIAVTVLIAGSVWANSYAW